MIRRPPRSTPLYSSAASDVYKRQGWKRPLALCPVGLRTLQHSCARRISARASPCLLYTSPSPRASQDLVCRLLLEKKNMLNINHVYILTFVYHPPHVVLPRRDLQVHSSDL